MKKQCRSNTVEAKNQNSAYPHNQNYHENGSTSNKSENINRIQKQPGRTTTGSKIPTTQDPFSIKPNINSWKTYQSKNVLKMDNENESRIKMVETCQPKDDNLL